MLESCANCRGSEGGSLGEVVRKRYGMMGKERAKWEDGGGPHRKCVDDVSQLWACCRGFGLLGSLSCSGGAPCYSAVEGLLRVLLMVG